MRQLALQGFLTTAEGVYTNEIQVRNYFPETWLWEDYAIPLTGKRVQNFKDWFIVITRARIAAQKI